MEDLRNSSKIRKFFLGSVAGVVILAIIASAIWDKAVSPIFDYIYKFLLNVSTLGLEVYRNAIYVEISKGFRERVSLEIYIIITSFFLASIILTTTRLWWKINNKISKKQKSVPNFKNIVPIILFLIFSITFISLEFIKTGYINMSVTYYNQLLKIASPEISDNQFKTFESLFNQIKTREDYVDLTNQLIEINNSKSKTNPKSPRFIF